MAKKRKRRRSPARLAPPRATTRRTPPPAPQPRRSDRRLLYLLGALVVVGLVAVVVARATRSDDTSAAGAGLLRTEAPWPPQYDGLRARVTQAGFPPVGDESFHVHALLSVYADGEPVAVPANIGIDQGSGYHSPLHTHTPDGVIHFEADEPATFTLQQVFAMWGVDFGPGRLGGYTTQGEKTVHVYVNGEPVDDPVGYEIQDQDNVVVAYGEAGSFPTKPPDDALATA